jgi:heme/copper-type cytochrome/quinol oxidase subunit 2
MDLIGNLLLYIGLIFLLVFVVAVKVALVHSKNEDDSSE